MPTITSTIVTVNATVTAAPAVSTLQRSGAIISEGGTTLTVGTYAYYGSLTALSAVIGTSGNHAEVTNMATSFFAQGSAIGVYVLELGVASTPAIGITALTTWITANPNVFYAYLTPANWDTAAVAFETLAGAYASPTSKTYFFGTASSSTIATYGISKSLFLTVPSPTALSTEFQAAGPFYDWLENNPTTASPAAPMAYRYQYGFTPWNPNGNQTTINTILTAYGNIIESGAEGGISNACLFKGTTMDGAQAMGWYAVDYILIQSKIAGAAAIINGSNSNPPLYYNQAGINQLLGIFQALANTAVAAGLLQSATITAIPYVTYAAAYPADIPAGNYNGFACTAVTQGGFLTITFNLNATTFG